MAIAIAIWSAVVEPGQKIQILPQADLRLTNASLGDVIADEKSRSSIKLVYQQVTAMDEDDEDEEQEDEPKDSKATVVLCSLTPGKIEQTTLDLVLEEEELYEIENTGKNAIHLSGNYINQAPPGEFDETPDMSEDEFEIDGDSDEEDGDEEGFAHISEVEEEATAKPGKRAREEMEVDEAADAKLSKNQKKKLNKKLKSEGGEAVPAGEANGTPKDSPSKDKADKKEKKEKKDDKKPETKDLGDGLKVTDISTGSGKTAKKGDTVSMRYIGKLENGKVFDSNTKGKPFTFRLGAGEVIKGWDLGIVGMAAGGERLLVIPPKLGYGNRKNDGIPAGSTLKFECKLLSIK